MNAKVSSAIFKHLTNYQFTYLEALYRKGSALAAWDAFLLARKNKQQIPEWVLDFIENKASKVMALETTDPLSVAHAIGLATRRGGKTDAKRYAARKRALSIAQSIAILKKSNSDHEWSDNKIIKHVADQCGVSFSTAKAAWRLHRGSIGYPVG